MAMMKRFVDLDATTNIDNLLGAAENADGLTPGNKFVYSADGTLVANSNSIVPTQQAIKTYSDTKLNKTLTQNHIYLGDGSNVAAISSYITINESTANKITIVSSNGSPGVSIGIEGVTAAINQDVTSGSSPLFATQSSNDNSTKAATTAYVDLAPGSLPNCDDGSIV